MPKGLMQLVSSVTRSRLVPHNRKIMAPLKLSRAGVHGVSHLLILEQTLPLHHQKNYYPVHVGDVYNGRYRIIAKLGYGAYSTVWLAKDEFSAKYHSLKVCVQDERSGSPVTNEVNMLGRLRGIAHNDDHAGLAFTRLATEIFEIEGESGRHQCIVAASQGNSLRTLQEILPHGQFPPFLVKSLVYHLLFSINWLHARCGVVHTDIIPQNVLLKAQDDTSFVAIEETAKLEPNLPIMQGKGFVYRSHATVGGISGTPILTDFGQMRLAEPWNKGWCMPDLYRAPEVILGLPWSCPVDIWSVGIMTLELLEGRNLFDPIDCVDNQYVLPLALAQYIGYLGPPPLATLSESPEFTTYFDGQGNWISEPPIPATSLEDFVTVFPDRQEKEMFLKFIRKILTWDPEERATSNELLEDEWLMTLPFESAT